MHEGLQNEIQTYQERTTKSAVAHKRAVDRLPLGVASNYRAYDPYPIFVQDGQGGHIRDLDGNDYVDFNLCFGALMAGHCHPAVVRGVSERLQKGTMFGMPHEMEWELAEQICGRFPVDMAFEGGLQSGITFTGRALNLSVHGLLLESRQPLRVGEDLRFFFEMPGAQEGVRGTATVVRAASGRHFGVELTHVEEDGRVRIKRYVESGGPD